MSTFLYQKIGGPIFFFHSGPSTCLRFLTEQGEQGEVGDLNEVAEVIEVGELGDVSEAD